MSRNINHGFEDKCSEETFNKIYEMAYARGIKKGKDIEQDQYKKMIENLGEMIPLHKGNKFEEGYHHALDQVEWYGRMDEVKHTTIS